MYKPGDNAAMRNAITIALQAAIKDVLKENITFKVNSSSINHTALQPEGDLFTILFQVETHRREEKPDDVRKEP